MDIIRDLFKASYVTTEKKIKQTFIFFSPFLYLEDLYNGTVVSSHSSLTYLLKLLLEKEINYEIYLFGV